jgi:hypothetical protein
MIWYIIADYGIVLIKNNHQPLLGLKNNPQWRAVTQNIEVCLSLEFERDKL